MKLIFFAQTALGLLIVIRTFQIFRARALLTASFLTKTGTIFVTSALLIAFYRANDVASAFAMTIANVFCSFATLKAFECRQIDAFKREIPRFLDRWILNLRLGSSVMSARERALRDHSSGFQALLRPIFASFRSAAALDAHPLIDSKVIREFEAIEMESHSALSRLENLRATLRKAADFRRKSGQAVRQTRAQSSLMLIMLVALIFYVLRRYPWLAVSDLITWSIVLSVSGVVSIHLCARKTRWKL